MKTCSRCEVEKKDSDFAKNAANEDQMQSYCRICMKEYNAARRKKKPEGWIRKTADMKAYLAQWKVDHPGYMNKKKKEWLQKNPERAKCRDRYRWALRSGKLVPFPCEVCGEKAEGHHPDYSKPLLVIWLCKRHHREAHRLLKD